MSRNGNVLNRNQNVGAVLSWVVCVALGNDKISSNVLLFDLPVRRTCPGMGECGKYCTSLKPEVGKWKGVPDARWANFWASLYDPNFVDKMVAKIRESGVRWVRFHVSGDLYRKQYLEAVAEIASRLKDEVNFFLYTKSLHLDLTPLTSLPNFTVIKSLGGKFDHLIDTSKDNYARVIKDPSEQWDGEFLCPEGAAGLTGKATEKFCGYNCFYCLSNKNTDKTEPHQIKVAFLMKKKGFNGTKLPPPPPRPAAVSPEDEGGR